MTQQSQHSPLRQNLPIILAVLVLVSMASADVLDWRRRNTEDYYKYMNAKNAWDEYYTRAANGKGLFLRFENFEGPLRGQTTSEYFRAVYLLYPGPVFASHDGVCINNAEQLLGANFQPDHQWMVDRGIGGILIVDGSMGFANPAAILPVSTTQPTTNPQ